MTDAPSRLFKAIGRVSVVTVCLNARQTIETTLRSVREQSFGSIEHVVIDGGSTDGTGEIVQTYGPAYFVSEPDNGLYYAMQKGAAAATGDIVFFLNSGDVFFDETVVAEVVKCFDETGSDAVFGIGNCSTSPTSAIEDCFLTSRFIIKRFFIGARSSITAGISAKIQVPMANIIFTCVHLSSMAISRSTCRNRSAALRWAVKAPRTFPKNGGAIRWRATSCARSFSQTGVASP